jgi:hypothetical protein
MCVCVCVCVCVCWGWIIETFVYNKNFRQSIIKILHSFLLSVTWIQGLRLVPMYITRESFPKGTLQIMIIQFTDDMKLRISC